MEIHVRPINVLGQHTRCVFMLFISFVRLLFTKNFNNMIFYGPVMHCIRREITSFLGACQLMTVVHNRTALKAPSSIEESCMLVACIETGTIIAAISQTKVLQDPLKCIKTK